MRDLSLSLRGADKVYIRQSRTSPVCQLSGASSVCKLGRRLLCSSVRADSLCDSCSLPHLRCTSCNYMSYNSRNRPVRPLSTHPGTLARVWPESNYKERLMTPRF
eukprot:365482-Chlamydomonas_euryale.AAC.16